MATGRRIRVAVIAPERCFRLRQAIGDHRPADVGGGFPVWIVAADLTNTKLTKEVFDDAPDSGSGRTTVFLFPSEVEEEMRSAGQPIPSRKAPEGPPGPLAGMEELEEPGG